MIAFWHRGKHLCFALLSNFSSLLLCSFEPFCCCAAVVFVSFSACGERNRARSYAIDCDLPHCIYGQFSGKLSARIRYSLQNHIGVYSESTSTLVIGIQIYIATAAAAVTAAATTHTKYMKTRKPQTIVVDFFGLDSAWYFFFSFFFPVRFQLISYAELIQATHCLE